MRHELGEMIALAEQLIASELPGTLATLFAARGSTYRPLGSMMVSMPGMHAGGVSGGCLDAYVAREGVLATRGQPAAMLGFSTAHETPTRTPVIESGGSIEILVERLTPEHITWLKELSAATESDAPSVLQCLVDSSGSALAVRRQWLHLFGCTTNVPQELEVLCRRVLREAKSCHVPLGANRALVHYVPSVSRLVLVGAGDDARRLCELGKLLGWHVTVVDRRARLATAARFPNADLVIAGDWDESLRRVHISSRTAVVLMTHSLEDDARVLALMDAQPPGYLGALGPAYRRELLLEEAAGSGATLCASLIARLRGPIGLDLGDRSPAGIALAVTAEILAWSNGRDGQPLYRKIPTDGSVSQRLASHA